MKLNPHHVFPEGVDLAGESAYCIQCGVFSVGMQFLGQPCPAYEREQRRLRRELLLHHLHFADDDSARLSVVCDIMKFLLEENERQDKN